MAARARAAEARLSDALHARLTERFVNRRTSVLMKKLGTDAALLPVELAGDEVRVDGEPIGHLAGFRFSIDPATRLADRKLLLAAAERHLPALRRARAEALLAALAQGNAALTLNAALLSWEGEPLAMLQTGRAVLSPKLALDPALSGLDPAQRARLVDAIGHWLDQALKPLAPLRKLEAAAGNPAAGPALRALLIRLVEAGGMLARDASGLDQLSKEQRDQLRRLGVRVGALDLFAPDMLRPAALAARRTLLAARGLVLAPPVPGMPPVVTLPDAAEVPPGYRRLGAQALRLDIAEKLMRAVHDARVKAAGRTFVVDPALAVSTGLATASYAQLLQLAGFKPSMPPRQRAGQFGPPQPPRWRWLPARRPTQTTEPKPRSFNGPGNVFAQLLR